MNLSQQIGRYFFLLCLFVSSLFANITSVTENDPSSFVEGVSIITGDLYVYEEDYAVQGAEPIRLRRSYISVDGVSRDYQHLICSFRVASNHLCVVEPNGTALFYFPESEKSPLIGKSFYGDSEKKKKWKSLTYRTKHFVATAPGVSNTASGKISAQTNLKNQYYLFDLLYRH